MTRKKIEIVFICFILVSICSYIQAEDIPSDVTPFVRLGHLVKVSIYKNPIIDQKNKKIIHYGQLIREEIVKMPAGSGTIISTNGLILTNYHVYQMKNNFRYDSGKRILYTAKPTSRAMLVYGLKDNDPLKVPAWQYIAVPVSLDADHDTALLKIVTDKDGNKITKDNFSFLVMGNPYAMKLNENITIIGYPTKGGDTITITGGKFLGYYRDERYYGLDGFIKTNAAMAPGNSGGAAINKRALIGVPTAVTLPTMAGSDMGYIHPVTWAVKVLSIAKHKFGFAIPEIPVQWLKSDYNTDETVDSIYVTGKILSAHSSNPLSARVIIARHDRTFEQIKNLHQELQAVMIVYLVKKLRDAGLSVKEMAERFKMTQEGIKKILALKLSKVGILPDAIRYIEGEFFYKTTQSDSEGFFILNVPRGRRVRVYILKEGFRSAIKDMTAGTGRSQSLGRIKIYQY